MELTAKSFLCVSINEWFGGEKKISRTRISRTIIRAAANDDMTIKKIDKREVRVQPPIYFEIGWQIEREHRNAIQ